MGATKHVLRRVAHTSIDLATGSVSTITGRLPYLVLTPTDDPGVIADLADALGLPDAGRFEAEHPPVFARTVKPRFHIEPVPSEPEATALALTHAKRGPVLTWPADLRTLMEVTRGGQALLLLGVAVRADGQPLHDYLARTEVHSGWIDVLRDRVTTA
ncbi:hypothetical protein EXU48_08855 [Occultella glacieicola]|uniref:Uncharacterized protein n=1 Tax=Occultella glacieicola TaxID=2518684 RepID=A0ABY2E849_9MICO|nr:hypothetical protein [Occultella glacieicola]TDE94887.1 hypothetical protein EXU48_08855 [Occultella glacieicola]